MNLNDIGKIGKILKDTQEVSKKIKNKSSEIDFSKILEEKISEKVKNASKSDAVFPAQTLLNIKQSSTEDIFIKKGFEKATEMIDGLTKFKEVLESDEFDLNKANNLIKFLQDTLGKLNSIVNNIDNPQVKEDLNKAIVIGNVEIEKYLRGDYF